MMISYQELVRTFHNIPLDSLFKPVPDSLMSEYLAMIDDQHPTGTMTA
ncbi:hypothetical protein REM94_12720 [Klebsiella pneumoniae]|nr:hypothetical protein REM94_12720 [Klebsiella pneumoniae]